MIASPGNYPTNHTTAAIAATPLPRSGVLLPGIACACALTLAALALQALLALALPPLGVIRMLLPAIALGQLAYLLWRAGTGTGRVTLGLLGLVLLLGTAFAPLALVESLAVAVALPWLARCLLFRRGILWAGVDLCLTVLAVGAGIWAFGAGHGLIAAIWCYLLAQAAIPLWRSARTNAESLAAVADGGRFAIAHRRAEEALARALRGA